MALLGHAHDRVARDINERLRAMTDGEVGLAHSKNVLRYLVDGPLRAAQLVERCGLSKQAVSQLLADLKRRRCVLVKLDPSDHRARLVEITPRGRRAQDAVAEIFADVEAELAGEVGSKQVAELRGLLERVIGRA